MIINPRKVTALPPTERTDGAALNMTNVSLELGYKQDGTWHELEQLPAVAEGEAVIFDVSDNRHSLVADTALILGARAIESRPDIVTDDFPNGVDLYSTWAEGGEVIYANPPQAPDAIAIDGAG